VSRGNSTAGEHAVKEPTPRAPELESPRLSLSAGVGMKGSVELWAARERLQPLLYVTPTGRPPLVKGGIVRVEEKRNGTTPGPGFRVYKIRVNRVNKDRLKVLYNDVIYKRNGNIPKGLLYYAGEWDKMFENSKRQREEAGKRTLPKTPPLPLLVWFVMPDGQERGNKCATCVIDLRRGELRIPSYGVVQKLPRSLVRALVEENNLNPRPDFVLQVTRKGLVRLIASRAPPPKQSDRLLLVCMDENLGHGLYTTLISFDGEKVKVARGSTFKPPNAALLRRIAAQLQSAADTGATSELRALIERAYEELGEKREVESGELYATPDRLRELRRRVCAREKRLNREWRNSVVAWLRRAVRENADARAVVLVDEVTAETARLLRRVIKRLRNLCAYEGAEYKPLRASGKYCPRCSARGVEVAHRVYKCPRCGLEWNRDRAATFALALNYAKIAKSEALRKALLEWLNKHPRALLS
jgi:Putative transposase DNA-binding domain.